MISKKYLAIILLAACFVPLGALAATCPDFFCDVGGIKVPAPWRGATGPAGELTVGGLIMSVITIALMIVGSIAVLFLIIGGFRYITASGNEEQTEAAKKSMLHAALGLGIVLLSFAMVSIISRLLIQGKVI